MNPSQTSHVQVPNGLRVEPEPLQLLDVATIVGGGLLSASGLLRGGIRGWISTTLGTLLLYRGILAVQMHASATSSGSAPNISGPISGGSSSAGPRHSQAGINDPLSAQVKGTCVSPGIVAPM